MCRHGDQQIRLHGRNIKRICIVLLSLHKYVYRFYSTLILLGMGNLKMCIIIIIICNQVYLGD